MIAELEKSMRYSIFKSIIIAACRTSLTFFIEFWGEASLIFFICFRVENYLFQFFLVFNVGLEVFFNVKEFLNKNENIDSPLFPRYPVFKFKVKLHLMCLGMNKWMIDRCYEAHMWSFIWVKWREFQLEFENSSRVKSLRYKVNSMPD